MLGGTILRGLLARGEEVRALVREPSAAERLSEAGAETVSGDLKEPASLAPACEGVSTLVATANSAARGGHDNVESVDLKGNRNLIETASAAGVEHFIFVSAQGEDPESPVPFLRAKGLTSQRLRESGMAYTVLVPDIYMDVWIPLVVSAPVASDQPVTIVGEGARKHYFVAVEDVAGFAVAAVSNDAVRNRDLLIGGPEALSWRDVISTFEHVNGVELEVQSHPPGQPMPGFPDAVSGLMAGLETYDSPAPISTAEAESTFGVRLTTLEEFLRSSSAGR
jgi:NADH dehydrogenase